MLAPLSSANSRCSCYLVLQIRLLCRRFRPFAQGICPADSQFPAPRQIFSCHGILAPEAAEAPHRSGSQGQPIWDQSPDIQAQWRCLMDVYGFWMILMGSKWWTFCGWCHEATWKVGWIWSKWQRLKMNERRRHNISIHRTPRPLGPRKTCGPQDKVREPLGENRCRLGRGHQARSGRPWPDVVDICWPCDFLRIRWLQYNAI